MTSVQASPSLPPEVVTCLQNARFLHLATCAENIPHVALMNYTYLPNSPYTSSPAIVMTTPPSSRKTSNLSNNRLVSLLVHDWVSHRPHTLTSPGLSTSPPSSGGQSSLTSLLLAMNTASLSRISVTINGEARLVQEGSDEESWFKNKHLENNTFETEDPPGTLHGGLRRDSRESAEGDDTGDGGKKCYLESEEARVVVVTIRDGRIADWKGMVQDWAISDPQRLVNGV